MVSDIKSIPGHALPHPRPGHALLLPAAQYRMGPPFNLYK
jgi:hypothetical protein